MPFKTVVIHVVCTISYRESQRRQRVGHRASMGGGEFFKLGEDQQAVSPWLRNTFERRGGRTGINGNPRFRPREATVRERTPVIPVCGSHKLSERQDAFMTAAACSVDRLVQLHRAACPCCTGLRRGKGFARIRRKDPARHQRNIYLGQISKRKARARSSTARLAVLPGLRCKGIQAPSVREICGRGGK